VNRRRRVAITGIGAVTALGVGRAVLWRNLLDGRRGISRIEAFDTQGPGFALSVRDAGRDAVSVSVAIVNGAIRVVGVLAPIAVILGLPLYVMFRFRRRRRAATVAT